MKINVLCPFGNFPQNRVCPLWTLEVRLICSQEVKDHSTSIPRPRARPPLGCGRRWTPCRGGRWGRRRASREEVSLLKTVEFLISRIFVTNLVKSNCVVNGFDEKYWNGRWFKKRVKITTLWRKFREINFITNGNWFHGIFSSTYFPQCDEIAEFLCFSNFTWNQFCSVRPIPNIRPNIRPKTADNVRPNIRSNPPISR